MSHKSAMRWVLVFGVLWIAFAVLFQQLGDRTPMQILGLAETDLWGQEIFNNSFDDPKRPPAVLIVPDGTRRMYLPSSDIFYGVFRSPTRRVSTTEWKSVWGANGALVPLQDFPLVRGAAPTLANFARDSYVCVHLAMPFEIQTGLADSFVIPVEIGGPNVTMAISTQCGDFTNHLPTPGCIKRGVTTSGDKAVSWNTTGVNPNTVCNLVRGGDYYVNVIQVDQDRQTECTKPVCGVALWRGG